MHVCSAHTSIYRGTVILPCHFPGTGTPRPSLPLSLLPLPCCMYRFVLMNGNPLEERKNNKQIVVLYGLLNFIFFRERFINCAGLTIEGQLWQQIRNPESVKEIKGERKFREHGIRAYAKAGSCTRQRGGEC